MGYTVVVLVMMQDKSRSDREVKAERFRHEMGTRTIAK